MIKSLILSFFINPSPVTDSLEFISPTKIIEQTTLLEEEEKYQEAIEMYLSVSENDTSYLEIMTYLLSTYQLAEEYDKAVEIGNKIKDVPSEFRKSIYIELGNTYLSKEDFEKSIETYKLGLELYPYSHVLLYNLGIAYRQQEKFDLALECFQNSALISPFYSNNHIMLGYIAMLQGHRTKSMLSYLTYLAIEPESNSILLFLENMVNNAARSEGSITPITNNDSFEFYDNLNRSKAALDSRFERKVDFNASISKQTELLLSKLKFQENTDDFWMEFYVPFYESIEKNQLSEAFIYHVLSSTKSEGVVSWIEKHDKEKSDWVDLANDLISKNRERQEAEILQEKAEYSFWYNSDNALTAIGNQIDDDTRIGPWEFYSDNGQLNAVGKYNDQSEMMGIWRYYHDNGVQSRVEYYDAQGNYIKPAEYYSEDGALSIMAHYKGTKLDSMVEYYYDCGQVKERYPYKLGEEAGKGSVFFETGEKKTDYTIESGDIVGGYTYYFKNGQERNEYQYESGALEGAFKSYYIDGQVNEEGFYSKDSLDGEWVGHHENGTISYTGAFDNGKRAGEWIFYHTNSNIKQKEQYNEAGKLYGKVHVYDRDGILSETTEYDNGKIVGYSYFSKDDKTLSNAYDAEGNMPYETYYATGEILAKGSLKNGKINGSYSKYFRNGNLFQKGVMLDDYFNGNYEEFYKTGSIKIKCGYKKGDLHGYYQSFYKNGQVENEGWYVDGSVEQLWTYYHPDGSKSGESYFISGEINGWSKSYAKEGKTHRAFKYDMGTLVAFQQYDTLGNVYHEADIPNGTGWRGYLTVEGDTTFVAHSTCGNFDIKVENRFPSGQTESKYPFKNSSLYDGEYVGYDQDGKVVSVGQYMNDTQHGSWKWFYDDGQIQSEYNYIRDKKEGKSIRYYYNGQVESECDNVEGDTHGTCNFYDLSGNLQLIKIYKNDINAGYLDIQNKTDTIAFINSGVFKVESHFDNGKLAAVQNYVDEVLDGTTYYYNKDGSKVESIEYKSGDNHGKWIRYYKNGNVHIEKIYENDLLNGDEKEYFPNGKLKSITPYINGEIDGTQIIYNTDGSIKYKNFYWNGYIY
ncbi:MAG: hypothetical protein JXR03_03280 [Cyclobacteriaceae bacterium]